MSGHILLFLWWFFILLWIIVVFGVTIVPVVLLQMHSEKWRTTLTVSELHKWLHQIGIDKITPECKTLWWIFPLRCYVFWLWIVNAAVHKRHLQHTCAYIFIIIHIVRFQTGSWKVEAEGRIWGVSHNLRQSL